MTPMVGQESFLAHMWSNVRPLVEWSLILLLMMFLWTLMHSAERGVRYYSASWQSRRVRKAIPSLLQRGDWEGVFSIAVNFNRSHVAMVYLNGLREFRAASESVSTEQSVEVLRLAARIAKNSIHEELQRGLNILSAISTTAPFVGIIGTVIGIFDSFRGYAGNKYSGRAFFVTNLAEALVPTAAGLLVGVLATWCLNWRSARLEMFDTEMELASLELVTHLKYQRRAGKL